MGPVSLHCCCGTSALDQLGNSFAQLRAFFLPVRHAIQLDTHAVGAFRSNRVVKPDALDETTITAIARIRYNHVKKWTVL